MVITVAISPGELIDKITILEIKCTRLRDPEQIEQVRAELKALETARAGAIPSSLELAALTTDLKAVNTKLWDAEDALRDCERHGDFGPSFVELARSVYRHNDQRSTLKRSINTLLGAKFQEVKCYAPYAQS
jgi:hypothetical protein